jgi:intracellular multiplication protein IcmC
MAVSFFNILQHIYEELPAFWRLIEAGTYLMGLAFAFISLSQLKKYGEARTMMSQQHDLKKPMISMLIAVALLFWPSLFHAMMISFYGHASPLSYSDTGGTLYSEEFKLIGSIIQFIGFVAFIRGWILLARVGQQGGQQGALGKALMHIIGGLFAVNIFETWTLLKSTLGI